MIPDAIPRSCPTPTAEVATTREVLLLIAELYPLTVRDGRILVPEDASEELAARIERYEGELLWARGYESGPRWGCAWVPARAPELPHNTPQRADPGGSAGRPGPEESDGATPA